METTTVQLLRQKCEQATFTLYNKDKNCAPADATKTVKSLIHVVCDNSLNVIYNPNNPTVFWDDANEVFYAFVYNTESTIHGSSPAMSFGDKPTIAGACICVDYGEIQNIRVQLTEEAYDNFANAIGMTDPQKSAIKKMLYIDTDNQIQIPKAHTRSYMTMTDKRKDPATRHYQDIHEYNNTVHPRAF